MKFTIITHVPHKYHQNSLFAYEPYVREMNLWGKYVSDCKIVAPLISESISKIDSNYNFNPHIDKISGFDLVSFRNKVDALFKIPIIIYRIFKAFFWADHIHLRCPGNIGMIGAFVQILFPNKKKTVKYAGNWDPSSKQPLTYRIQKWIISSSFLTRNCKVLVYGQWPHQSNNILPFFTATYKKSEIEVVDKESIYSKLKLIYVGSLTSSKQPMLSLKAAEQLLNEGVHLELNIYGMGSEYENLRNYIQNNSLQNDVFLHRNQDKQTIKKAFQESHFLIFLSQSEGWPKVVAEAMFWGCIPISSRVSCVPFMLDFGNRGSIVEFDVNQICQEIKKYIRDNELYSSTSSQAKNWSQMYTLDHFSAEIQKLL